MLVLVPAGRGKHTLSETAALAEERSSPVETSGMISRGQGDCDETLSQALALAQQAADRFEKTTIR